MKLVKEVDGKMPSLEKGSVRVKMLKHVSAFTPGDIVDCSEHDAEYLCKQTKVDTGGSLENHQKAMKLEDVKKLKEAKLSAREIQKMSAKEMQDLGIRNIVKTPHDAKFENDHKAAAKAAAEESKKLKAAEAAKKSVEADIAKANADAAKSQPTKA